MVSVEHHPAPHLDQLARLINSHLAEVMPGWRLPIDVIARSLATASPEHCSDPWVAEGRTLCALEDDRLVGAAQVLRYGSGPEIGSGYRDAAELAWLLFWPGSKVAAGALMDAARMQMMAWGASNLYACDTSLPVPVVNGVPDSWPHISSALIRGGFRPMPSGEEVLYVGNLPEAGAGGPPIAGLVVRAVPDEPGQRFLAELNGAEIGFLDWLPDLSFGGTLPALAGWAQLASVAVRDEWRGRGVGRWLVRRTASFLRMLGVRRVVVALTASQEAAGAGILCRRLGWDPLVRIDQGWKDSR